MDSWETSILGTMVKVLSWSIFGNTLRDYLISAVIVAATVLLAVFANRILKKRLLTWAEKSETKLDEFLLTRVFTPGVYILVIMGLAASLGHLQIEPLVSEVINKVLLIAGLAIFFLMIVRSVQGLVELLGTLYCQRLARNQPDDLEIQIQAVERIKKQVREISNMVLAILAVLTILSNLGVDLKAIWASLGIGGIAIVVAVKEPLSNLVGRMYIFSTGIFDEGHFIVFGEWSGTVKRISMFRTYMELFSDMTTVSIPNADFVKGVVKTYYGRTRFMFKWDLDVPYDVSSAGIRELLQRLTEHLQGKPEVSRERCWIYLDRLDRYSKVVRVWFQAALPDWAASLYYGDAVLHEIQEIFAEMEIDFAFPTQTLHVQTVNPETGRSETAPTVLPEPDPAA